MLFKRRLFAKISDYINKHYIGEEPVFHARASKMSAPRIVGKATDEAECMEESAVLRSPSAPSPKRPAPIPTPLTDLSDSLRNLDENFQQALLRMIDERGMKDSVCYKRAGVDRKLFSKIRSNPDYRPSKPTAIAFAIALELDLDETTDFLRKAGYALSHSSKFDVIVEYFIVSRRYSLRELNEALYEFDQPLINA